LSTAGRAVRERLIVALVVAVTAVAALLVTTSVRLNPDVVALLPSRGDAAALARYLRGFGGGGVSVVLIQGPDADHNAEAALATERALATRPSVAFSRARIDAVAAPDPMLAWRIADAPARARLAAALTPEGMRERLDGTRQLLLAPGSGAAVETLARDPLRLAELLAGDRAVGSGVSTRSDGFFATEHGSSHLVVVKPHGQALRGSEARAFTDDVDRTLAELRAAHPDVTFGVTGPHVVAAQMEGLLRTDLTRSGVISGVLASLAFALVFWRVRALAAILPPLALGTLWTAALAVFWPGGISAIAVAFTSVVVGVGFDTGVHVYAALLDARRRGLSPADAAHAARSYAARPVLIAATIAAVAFASLALSSVEALAQLGLLCAAGEIFTALAIVGLTPAIGALLERGDPPTERPASFFRAVAGLTRTRARAAIVVSIALALGGSVFVTGVHVSDSLVAVRPSKLDALDVERRIFEVFGGRPQPFIILVADPSKEAAMRRADVLAENLAADAAAIERVDALVSLVPSETTQRVRLAERDALDMPAKAAELARALEEKGFAVPRFEGALEAMRKPPRDVIVPDEVLAGDLGVLGARYLATDGAEHLAALHVHLTPETSSARLAELVRGLDDKALVTGYAKLEIDLRGALANDLPRIGAVAGVLVVVLLFISLRRAREVAIALGVLVLGIALLLALAGVLKLPLHIYSALVIPVLCGITVDEAMFLLHQARREGDGDPIERALVVQGRPVVTTALTTTAGFAALAFASYDGLRHLGLVGALGNLVTLVMALVLVPAGLRLLTATAR